MSVVDGIIEKYTKENNVSSEKTNNSSSIVDNIINKINKQAEIKESVNNDNKSFVQKKEEEALAAKDDPTFFSETIRALVGGVGDATNKITGLAADAGKYKFR